MLVRSPITGRNPAAVWAVACAAAETMPAVLDALRTSHINAFYRNLQEEGIRRQDVAICKIDFAAWLREHHTTATEMSQQHNMSLRTFRQIRQQAPMSVEKAKAVAKVIDMEFADAFNIKRKTEPLSPKSIISYHATLSAVLSKAVKWKYIEKNPATGAELPSVGNAEAACLEEEDARKLLELLREEPIKWRTIITFDLLSGMRRGELAGLYWADLDYKSQTVKIQRTLNYIPKEGVYEDTAKSEESNRVVKLSPSAFFLLTKYKEWQDSQKEKLGDAWEDKVGRIFTSDAGAPIFPDSITQWFSKFISRTGLPKVTVHSLRHTYASLMIAEDIPLVIISKQLGHAQVSTTTNIYGHAIKSARAKAVEVFDRFNDIIIPGDNSGGSKCC